MKKYTNYLILFLLALSLFWPSIAYAKESHRDFLDDKVVFGGTYTLESGQSLDGNLVIFGGAVTTEEGSTVNGDVALIGGVVEVGGQVNGNLVGIGGAVQVTSTAVVNGDLVTIGATLSRDEGARVTGQIVNGINVPFTFDIPSGPANPNLPALPEVPGLPAIPKTPGLNVSFNPFLDMLWFFFRTFMWALLAVLVVIFFVKPTERIAKTAVAQPLITTGAGLLIAFLTPFVLVALTLTIILIPVTLIAVLALLVAWMFGWVALGLEIGRRIAKLFNTEWAPAIAAGVGTLILFLVLGGINQLVPCVGWIPQTLVGMWGFGAVVMTRFGTQDYPVDGVTPGTSIPGDDNLPSVVIPQFEASASSETVAAPVPPEDSTSEDPEIPADE